MKKLILILIFIIPFISFGQINDTWDAVKVGTTDMQKIYVGSTLVWQKSIPAPYYVSQNSSVAASGATSLTINYPSGVESGDLLVMIVFKGTMSLTDSYSTPNGWTKINNTESSINLSSAVYVRTVGSSEPSSVSVTCGGVTSSSNLYGIILRYTNLTSYTNNSILSVSNVTSYSVANSTIANNRRRVAIHLFIGNTTVTTGGTYGVDYSNVNTGGTLYNQVFAVSATNCSCNWSWSTTSNIYTTSFRIDLIK